MIRARSREQRAASGECDQDARDGTQGQAAARGQFALFDKVRALKRWYQRHGAGSKGQGADGARSRVIRVKGSASRGGGSGVEHEHEHDHDHEHEHEWNPGRGCLRSVD